MKKYKKKRSSNSSSYSPSSSSSFSSNSIAKGNSKQYKQNEIVTRAGFEEKVKDLRILLNNPSDILLKKEQEIKKILTFLRNNECEFSINIINKHPPPKICSFCNQIIDENYKFAQLECCPNKFVHKSCIVYECVKLSSDLKENELKYSVACKVCQKFLPFEFLKDFLQDKIREIKNRRKPCINCEKLKPQSELTRKFCDHYYCNDCLRILLATLVDEREVSYDKIKCKSVDCDVLLFEENDFKNQFNDKYYEADEFYGRITNIKKNEVIKRCMGAKNCPQFMKNSNKSQYICLKCENNMKKVFEKKEEKNPPQQ